MLFFGSFILNVFGFGVFLFALLIAYYRWSFRYWQRRKLPYLEPSIPFGTSYNPVSPTEHYGVLLKRQYDKMKFSGWKHGGLFTTLMPYYTVIDLDYIKNIFIKDFHYFTDRSMYYNEKDDPLSAHLFALGGSKWRHLRNKLTPTFTSGKMKIMFQTLLDCKDTLLKKISENDTAIDIKEVLSCFSTDVIGSCAFGLECDSFKDDNSPFRIYSRKFFTPDKSTLARLILSSSFPNVARRLRVCFTPKDISDFFFNVVKDTVRYREENNVTRNDFMQLLIDLKNNRFDSDYQGATLTVNELTAHSFLFFIAGFETSSTVMTFTLYALGKHQELQEKVRSEIKTVLKKYNGRITYEAIKDMKYMDQVIKESTRMYPPLPVLSRQCVRDYKVPHQDVIIQKGTPVVISVLGIHYDKDYFPNPETFDPERFNEQNESKLHSCAYLAFGEGPRNCIGIRFGLMQVKVGLTTLLANYNFTVNERTKEPLQINARAFLLSAEGEIWLDVQKL